MLTGEVGFVLLSCTKLYTNIMQLKAICIEYLQKYVAVFQDRRSKVTDAVVDEFMSVRPLEWKGNPRVPRADLVVPVTTAVDGTKPAGDAAGTGELSKNAQKKLLKEQQLAAKKAEKERAKAAAAAAAGEGGA